MSETYAKCTLRYALCYHFAMNERSRSFQLYAAAVTCISLINVGGPAVAEDLKYTCSTPPLQVTFDVAGGHYSGVVNAGNLFLEPDIPKAPVVRFPTAAEKKLYTLMMLDFDGNATGAWPEPVPSGENSPVRHWIVGNIPGALLRQSGYDEESKDASANKNVSVIQSYRSPHIPMVSDRYGVYLFEQSKRIDFAPIEGPITNFDHVAFLKKYNLVKVIASNYFVAIYTSVSPFSGKPFQGNDVSKTWHRDLGKGKLTE